MQITLSQLSFTYDNAAHAAHAPVTATFSQGWTGIVGVNGSGKSTLLKVVCGKLNPTQGSITPRATGVYCAQETELMPANAEDFIYDYSKEALAIKRVLEIEDDWLWRYDTLSEGQRKRLQVATALWGNPVVLALDEPTNHVDAACRRRLLAALKAYKGVGLLVSHDRTLLDELTQQCLFMSTSHALMRPGNYSEGSAQEQLERVTAVNERKQAKDELARLRQTKVARSQEAARADGKRSKRGIAKGDKDAKARIDLAIYSGQDGKAGKRSVQMDAHVAAAEKRVAQAHVEKIYSADLWLDTEPSHRKTLVLIDEGGLAYGTGKRLLPATAPCLHIPTLTVGPTDHIALVGANGTGKSTLITALVRALPQDLRCVYLPQELNLEQRKEQVNALEELSQQQRGSVLSIVAQLNSDPQRLLSGNQASPGETRKLMLALGVLEQPHLIIMDEPTNHLDLASTEALEAMLAQCPCALVLVSHDEQFLQQTTSICWSIAASEEGSVLTAKG